MVRRDQVPPVGPRGSGRGLPLIAPPRSETSEQGSPHVPEERRDDPAARAPARAGREARGPSAAGPSGRRAAGQSPAGAAAPPSRHPDAALGRPGQPDRRPRARPEAEAGKRLIVGQGISLSGEITACDRLVVQGSVQVTLNETRAIEITESGRFTNGKAEVEEAEISGVYEGDLTVRNRLLIRSTGQVKGNVRYGEIEVERGGRITGSISMLEVSGK